MKNIAEIKQQKIKNKEKGITLIALVITIIVLLILAAVSIATLTGDNGILTKAQDASDATIVAQIEEEIRLWEMEKTIYDLTGEGTPLSEDDFINSLISNGLITEEDYDSTSGKITINGVEIELSATSTEGDDDSSSEGDNIGTTGGLSITDAVASGLEIGDFINYDAGTWSQEEIDSLNSEAKVMSISGSADEPTTDYQFGGFSATASRNGNATPYSTSYEYVQVDTDGDNSGDTAISGWRVFDITDGVITLISAGNPEDYYHPNDSSTSYESYISQYILSGTENSNIDESLYTVRDWTMYENEYAVESTNDSKNARVLTKTELDSWYEKYTLTNDADTYTDATFQLIYDTDTDGFNKYQTLVDNYSYYWFGSAYNSSTLYFVAPSDRYVGSNRVHGYGVRLLVSLKSDISLVEEDETITVVNSRSTTYGPETWEHTVWNIAN